jgi:hypothetical protein
LVSSCLVLRLWWLSLLIVFCCAGCDLLVVLSCLLCFALAFAYFVCSSKPFFISVNDDDARRFPHDNIVPFQVAVNFIACRKGCDVTAIFLVLFHLDRASQRLSESSYVHFLLGDPVAL